MSSVGGMEVAEGQVTEGRRELGHWGRRVKSWDGEREGESLGERTRRAAHGTRHSRQASVVEEWECERCRRLEKNIRKTERRQVSLLGGASVRSGRPSHIITIFLFRVSVLSFIMSDI